MRNCPSEIFKFCLQLELTSQTILRKGFVGKLISIERSNSRSCKGGHVNVFDYFLSLIDLPSASNLLILTFLLCSLKEIFHVWKYR